MRKTLDQRFAERHASTIKEVWHKRGFTQVEAWAEPKGSEWGVRTNLVNGAPPGTRPETLGYQLMGVGE